MLTSLTLVYYGVLEGYNLILCKTRNEPTVRPKPDEKFDPLVVSIKNHDWFN